MPQQKIVDLTGSYTNVYYLLDYIIITLYTFVTHRE